MKVLVTGTSTFFSARIVQELGRQQAVPTAADSLRWSAGKLSRYCRERLLMPHLGHNPAGYLDAVRNALRRGSYDLLLPTFEESLLLAEYQDELRQSTRLLLPDFETMLAVHCKPILHARCREWGIPSPDTFWPANAADLHRRAHQLTYPVLIKLPMANNSIGRTYCANAFTLINEYKRLTASTHLTESERPFVQRYIDGELICTLMLCSRGRKYGEVIYRSLRTLPDQGGTSVHRESIEHPAIEELTSQFAAKTNWSGFVGMDFLVDRQTGIPHLVDVNPRANPAVNLGFMAGVNWTGLIRQLAFDEETTPVAARPGVRSHNVLMDIAWLFEGMQFGPNWWARSCDRLRRLLRPGWTSHGRDLLSCREDWGPTAALGLHGLQTLLRSCVGGAPMGRTVLDDANYNPVTAARLSGRDVTSLLAMLQPNAREAA